MAVVRAFGGVTRFLLGRLRPFGSKTPREALLVCPLVAHAVRAQRPALVCRLPLGDSGPPRAPRSPSTHRAPTCLLGSAPASYRRDAFNLAVPKAPSVSLILLLSRRLRRVNPAPSSGMDGTPDPFRPSQRPLVSSPGLWSVVCASASFSWSGRLRLSATSVAFHRPLSPHGSLTSTKPATLLSITLRRCRPTACSVSTPPLSRIGPSQSPLVISPGPSRARRAQCARRLFSLSGGAFPRERLSNPDAALSPRGSQGPVGLATIFVLRRQPHTQVCMLPLLL